MGKRQAGKNKTKWKNTSEYVVLEAKWRKCFKKEKLSFCVKLCWNLNNLKVRNSCWIKPEPLSVGALEVCNPQFCSSHFGPHSSYSFKWTEWEEQSQGRATQGCFSTQGWFLHMHLHHEPPPLHSTQTWPSSRIPHLREWLHYPSLILISVGTSLSFSNHHESCLVHFKYL